MGAQPDMPAAAMLAGRHEACLLKDADMLLHGHQRDGQRLGKLAQRPLANLQARQQGSPCRVGQGGEGLVQVHAKPIG